MVVYRKALAEDVDAAAVVLLKNYNIKNLEEAKEVYLEELSIYNYLVADEDGKVVGVACWRMHGLPKHQLAECARVAILPKYKGGGVATELFGRVVRDADRFYKTHGSKLRKIYAYMHSSNKKAQEFFSGLGLIREAVLKDHYYKGEDEYIYSMFMD